VIDLTSQSPFGQALPLTIGGIVISEKPHKNLWSVAPFAGQQDACVAALRAVGIAWPDIGRATADAFWFGMDQVMITRATLPDLPAAVTDQRDAWARVTVKGQVRDVLARLVPVDQAGIFHAPKCHGSTLPMGRWIIRP